ncbi:MAG: aldehyde dehydrogenase [bacterium]
MTDGFDWLEKDRKVAQRDLARAYGFARRDAQRSTDATDTTDSTASFRSAPAASVDGAVVDVGNLIAGTSRPAADGRTISVINPATSKEIATIPRSGTSDVAAAVAAAKTALPAWSATPLAKRCAILTKAADLIESRMDEFASLESRDTGKPVKLARSLDVPRAISNLRFFAEFAVAEGRIEHPMPGHLNYTVRAPVGVVGLITPWNLPIYLLSWKAAPALAMGNTVVAKPSELTPLSADALGKVLLEAGLPPGVFNVVHGLGPEAGQALVEHPEVRAISFTGGTATGRRVAQSAAPHLKKVSLELGGKNPTIVFADCDMDATVEGVVRSAFTNTGQICLCGSRILVEAKAEKEFTKRLVARTQQMKVGDPADPATDLGSLVSKEHRAKVEAYITIAKADGGRIPLGGSRPKLPTPFSDGAFLEPTIVTGLAQSSRCVQEEIFGPVVTIQAFADEAEAVRLANDVRYGLAASVWTTDAAKAKRVAEALDTGMVWVNCWLVRDLRVPFGGMKESGVGREGGRHSLDFFSEPRNICVKGGAP